jgi:8-hydroxy-5-deazaflavin:NADPH oxidoreductase
MKIGIIGSGHIGGNLARLLVKAGYDVALSNSRGPSSLRSFVHELGGQLQAVETDGAVSYGEIVIVSIPWRHLGSLSFFNVPGKIVVDTTNPYKEDGSLYDLGTDISSNRVVEHFPGGRVVKAFNTIWYKHLAETGDLDLPLEDRRVIPVAGDDIDAKETVSQIIQELGFGPLDTGNLIEGSKIQGVEGVLYNKILTVKEAESIMKDLHLTY